MSYQRNKVVFLPSGAFFSHFLLSTTSDSTAGSLILRKDSPKMKMDTTNRYMDMNMR